MLRICNLRGNHLLRFVVDYCIDTLYSGEASFETVLIGADGVPFLKICNHDILQIGFLRDFSLSYLYISQDGWIPTQSLQSLLLKMDPGGSV